MKCFFSWSGILSQEVGEVFSNWLRGTLQSIEIFFSPEIEKGSKWIHKIHSELENTDFGMLFLTKENTNSPWLLYESGALAKKVSESRLYTILVDLNPSDVSGPLSYFQHTSFTKKDIFKLLSDLNQVSDGLILDTKVLSDVFDSRWKLLEEPVKLKIDRNTFFKNKTSTDREIIENVFQNTNEILNAIRGEYDLRILDQVVAALEDKRRVMEFVGIEEDEYSESIDEILQQILKFYKKLGMSDNFTKIIERERSNDLYKDGRFVSSAYDQ